MDEDVFMPHAEQTDEGTNGLYQALAHPRRRVVVSCLAPSAASAGGDVTAISLDELASEVATAEVPEGTDADEERRRRVRISLHHCHLPKLDALDVLEYDSADQTVRYRRDDVVDELLYSALTDAD